MAERKLIIDRLKFSYEGLFNVAELYALISSWFYEKGWDWHERVNEELVTSEGKQIRLVLEPWKSVSDFYKLEMHIMVHFINVKDVEIEQDGQVLNLSQGLVRILFDAYVISDRNGQWSEKPVYWLLTVLSQKYFFRSHFEKMEIWLKSDVDDLYQKIKNYLNVFKYTYRN